MTSIDGFLYELENIIKDRDANPKEGSYTNKLLQEGVDRICRKVGEEASELIIAAKNNDKEEIKNETADVIYHIWVLLRHLDINIQDIEAILRERHQPK